MSGWFQSPHDLHCLYQLVGVKSLRLLVQRAGQMVTKMHSGTSERWTATFKGSRWQGQTQSRAGLDTRVGGSRLPGSPLEFLQSLSAARGIRIRVWGGTSWAAGRIPGDPAVGRNRGEAGNQVSPDISNQVTGILVFNSANSFPETMQTCDLIIKPVNSRGSRFRVKHAPSFSKYKTAKCSTSFLPQLSMPLWPWT